MPIMPQFPLGTVLFPSMVLPLHVFEPRYRTMIRDVLAGDRTFGVVLIDRGSEVGGQDQRSMFGTTATIVDAEQLSDGRWAVRAVGAERFAVSEWLPDDPYPRARVEPWPDDPAVDGLEQLCEQVADKFCRCMALASESGLDVGPVPTIGADVTLGCMQMAALGPFSAYDKQRLLGAASAEERFSHLDELLDDAIELIRLRLGAAE